MAFETMTTASTGTGYVPSEDAKRTGNIQYLYDRRVEVLDVVTADTTFSNSGSENTLYSCTVPGSTLGTDGMLKLRAGITWVKEVSNGSFTITACYAGVQSASAQVTNGTGTGSGFYVAEFDLKARGTTGSQYSTLTLGGFNIADGANFFKAVSGSVAGDSSASQSLVLTGKMTIVRTDWYLTINYATLEYYAAR